MNARDFFTPDDQKAIMEAISAAERETSGEIRVHIENSFKGDVLDQASYLFKKLQMHKTAERNGVLIYLAIRNRQFAIIGDAGINAVVPEGFWDSIKEQMGNHFREGNFREGLIIGIRMSGQKLQEHFPCKKDDQNELSNEISFGS